MGTDEMMQLMYGPMTWNTVVGEADRAFRRGLQLEKSGYARSASNDFHEAATLYQCVLDSESCFGHVTNLSTEDCSTFLSYLLTRLGFLNRDALSDPKAAVRLYHEAIHIDPSPSATAYQGVGTSIEAAGGNGIDLSHLETAVENYRQALTLSRQKNTKVKFHMAVALERLGHVEESEQILETLRRDEAPRSCLVDSWGYVRWHTRKVPPAMLNLHRGTRCMLKLALEAAMPLIEQGGLVCEFGVGSGRSLRMTQELLPLTVPIHGFDTFTGLPQAWGDEPAGAYSTGGVVPNMEGDVYFYKGLFGDTIAPFLRELSSSSSNKDSGDKTKVLAYANVDCDLYTSTLDILEAMHGRVVPGTILIFDEYICHPTWRQDEFRAWRECCKRFGWKYEYLGFSFSTKQAVVRVTEA